MNEKPENTLAFPLYAGDKEAINIGMTLRDYFAAKAMQAFLSNPYHGEHLSEEQLRFLMEETKDHAFKLLAKYSYEIADAMLSQRII